MNSTILFDMLRTFSVEELKKFGEMTRSPYFNKLTAVTRLFDEIKSFYPDFRDSKLMKDKVYLRMFPDKKYNYGSMKNIIYDLQKLAETFIADQEIKRSNFDVKWSLINGLHERKLSALSEKNLKEIERTVTGKEIVDDDYFLKLYKLDRIKRSHIYASAKGNPNINEKKQVPYFNQLLRSATHLKKYYLLDTLRNYNYIITNKNILKAGQILRDCEEFLDLYAEEEFEEISLNLEMMFLKMNLGKITEKEFLQFRELVFTDLYEVQADKSIMLAYSIYLMNYCRIKNKTDKKYLRYAFEIIENLSDNDNFVSRSGYMNIVLVRNILLIATELKEFDWCEKFLETCIGSIHPDYRDNMITFYHAHKNFYEGNFEQSLEFLSKLTFDDIYNKNYIKKLLVINYYELKYFDLLNEQIESYKKFLSNNVSLPESYKEGSVKFVDYMCELCRRTDGGKSDLQFLKKKVMSEKELQNKEWFIEKIEELEASKK